jgi:hypothetical protein
MIPDRRRQRDIVTASLIAGFCLGLVAAILLYSTGILP